MRRRTAAPRHGERLVVGPRAVLTGTALHRSPHRVRRLLGPCRPAPPPGKRRFAPWAAPRAPPWLRSAQRAGGSGKRRSVRYGGSVRAAVALVRGAPALSTHGVARRMEASYGHAGCSRRGRVHALTALEKWLAGLSAAQPTALLEERGLPGAAGYAPITTFRQLVEHLLADESVERAIKPVLVGRLRSDRVMLRDPGLARSGPRGGRPRRHGAVLTFAEPDTWHEPDVITVANTTPYGRAEARAWDRMPQTHPPRPLAEPRRRRTPILRRTLIRLKVEHLPGDRAEVRRPGAAGRSQGRRRSSARGRARGRARRSRVWAG